MSLSPPRAGAVAVRALALAAVLATAAPPTHATTVRRIGLPEMVERARHVVLVRALDNEVRTDPDTLHHHTVTRFQVLEAAKGPRRPGEIFELSVLGGHAPGSIYETTMPGAPRFEVGEELVLFTRPSRSGPGEHILGFFQGAVRLRLDEEGNRVLVSAPPDLVAGTATLEAGRAPAPLQRSDQASAVAPAAGAAPVSRPPTSRPPAAPAPDTAAARRGPVSVSEFMADIRARVAAAAPRGR